jgi:hypothetical protein
LITAAIPTDWRVVEAKLSGVAAGMAEVRIP